VVKMVLENMVCFIKYLEHHGYVIPVDKAARVLRMLPEIKGEEDLIGIMRINFCSDKSQYICFREEFHKFMEEKTEEFEQEISSRDESEKNRKLEDTISEKREEINRIEKDIHKKEKEILESGERKLSSKDALFIRENNMFIVSAKWGPIAWWFVAAITTAAENSSQIPYMPKESLQMEEETVQMCEKALSDGKMDDFTKFRKLNEIVHGIMLLDEKQKKIFRERIKNETKDLNEKRKILYDSIRNEEENYLNKRTDKNTEHMLVVKKESKIHREKFIKGGNSVQLSDNSIIGILGERFEDIDDMKISDIYRFLEKNALKFKTRMQKSINRTKASETDMKKTIEQACKTGGLPLKIIHKAPEANRAKLMICLDMSGSCCEASKMMLSFIYILQGLFPAGCSAYAFVNRLYDISGIMKEDNILDAINSVMGTVPTRGIYSNYYIPLKELWELHGTDITSDTFVIFIGDARNNSNDTGVEYLKNIARKAKKALWLNTEPYYYWGVKDSVATEYAKYFSMHEVTTPMALIEAIEKI